MSFSCQHDISRSALTVVSASVAPFLKQRPPLSIGGPLSLLNSHWLKPRWCWNINQLSIIYALRPRLRSRLTLGGRTFPRKPWVYGVPDFNRDYRYSCLHSHFWTLQFQLPSTFDASRTLPYSCFDPKIEVSHSFGTTFDRQSFSARNRSMSQLLRTV